jgi:hypothetical protein
VAAAHAGGIRQRPYLHFPAQSTYTLRISHPDSSLVPFHEYLLSCLKISQDPVPVKRGLSNLLALRSAPPAREQTPRMCEAPLSNPLVMPIAQVLVTFLCRALVVFEVVLSCDFAIFGG